MKPAYNTQKSGRRNHAYGHYFARVENQPPLASDVRVAVQQPGRGKKPASLGYTVWSGSWHPHGGIEDRPHPITGKVSQPRSWWITPGRMRRIKNPKKRAQALAINRAVLPVIQDLYRKWSAKHWKNESQKRYIMDNVLGQYEDSGPRDGLLHGDAKIVRKALAILEKKAKKRQWLKNRKMQRAKERAQWTNRKEEIVQEKQDIQEAFQRRRLRQDLPQTANLIEGLAAITARVEDEDTAEYVLEAIADNIHADIWNAVENLEKFKKQDRRFIRVEGHPETYHEDNRLFEDGWNSVSVGIHYHDKLSYHVKSTLEIDSVLEGAKARGRAAGLGKTPESLWMSLIPHITDEFETAIRKASLNLEYPSQSKEKMTDMILDRMIEEIDVSSGDEEEDGYVEAPFHPVEYIFSFAQTEPSVEIDTDKDLGRIAYHITIPIKAYNLRVVWSGDWEAR